MLERLQPPMAAVQSWLPVLSVALAAALATLLVYLVGAHLVRRATAGTPVAEPVVRAIRGPARLLPVLVALSVVWHGAADDLPGLAMVQRLTAMTLIGAITWTLVRAINAWGDAVIAANPVAVENNLEARRIQTQTRAVTRTVSSLVALGGVALALMAIPAVRQIGAGLLASAGVIGLVAGFAARPVLGNLIAGLQIGLTQPIRIDDVVIVEGEWGVIEEITGAYVVVRVWDERRLVVPLQYWVEKPFQNWTRRSAQLTGTVTLWVDYRTPIEPLRAELRRLCEDAAEWDRRTCVLQVVDAGPQAIQLRALVSAADAPKAWDLRCKVREGLVQYLQREQPQHLPRLRVEMGSAPDDQPAP